MTSDERWADAALVAALLAIDPDGLGGVCIAAFAGPVREDWMDLLRAGLPEGTPMRRIPPNVSDDRLIGGLDLVETLRAQRRVARRGLLAEADQGLVVLPMCERLSRSTRAELAAALDRGECVVERDGLALRMPARFGVIAWDEGDLDDAPVGDELLDRVAFRLDLKPLRRLESAEPMPSRLRIARARAGLANVAVADELRAALCEAAMKLGIASLRPVMFAVRAARALAALAGDTAVSRENAALAARLVLSPRATVLDAVETNERADDAADDGSAGELRSADEDASGGADRADADDSPARFVVAAAQAAIPPGLLRRESARRESRRRASHAGRAGPQRKSAIRGRPVGTRPGDPRGGARLDLLATLRAAAPWQRLRRAAGGSTSRVDIRRRDFHVTTFKQRTQNVAIFIVDASGSSALERLSEAKGAVERLLAECYVRRDQVAVIGFRDRRAELLLPPTRSLVRARRGLAALPGGGGTPLAAAIDAGRALAEHTRRAGREATLVLLTDGHANIARDGKPDRSRAGEDARAAARAVRSAAIAALLIDIARRPQAEAARLAAEMDAAYVPLPHADARAISSVVQSAWAMQRSPG